MHATRALAVCRPQCSLAPSLGRRSASLAARASAQDQTFTSLPSPSFGVFLCSGSAVIAETLSHSGVDWVCIDGQHGALGYAEYAELIRAVALGKAKSIVRVGGPDDRYAIQQALDQGADGVMIPLVNTAQEAARAVSYCLYAPEGIRSAVYPSAAAIRANKGPGPQALSSYLRNANKRVEVWLQIETGESLSNLDGILSTPGVDCAFLGPADMALSLGLHTRHDYDLAGALASQEMQGVFGRVLQACQAHGVAPGVFTFGADKAAALGRQGYVHVGFEVDTNLLAASTAASMASLRRHKQQA